jgi:hypothetical protein
MARTRVKSTKRQEHALRVMAQLPRDPVTGRMLKRGAVSPGGDRSEPPAPEKHPRAPDPQNDPQKKPAGGPAPTPLARGIRRWTRR